MIAFYPGDQPIDDGDWQRVAPSVQSFVAAGWLEIIDPTPVALPVDEDKEEPKGAAETSGEGGGGSGSGVLDVTVTPIKAPKLPSLGKDKQSK
jgi:hypothetical protein